ncbi:protein ST7 homolog [Oscarella lobularis]|uniref:protein ST7 homolog n=1 Tax=Oscarella lobularis TaxID=121494 RepID=UPI003313415B
MAEINDSTIDKEADSDDATIWTRFKLWICWSCTHLWGVWFLLIVFLLWALRSPLKLRENISYSAVVFSNLSPKFYVALTGTSSLISGLILIFEWVYYRRYGQSFIESVSLRYLSSLLGASEPASTSPECKVWKNPLSLFRGAEYQRYRLATGIDYLTTFDSNMTLQENQSHFTRDSDERSSNEVESLMYRAWQETNPKNRLNMAQKALTIDPNCPSALVLLAEEKAETIVEIERYLKVALKSAEEQQRKTHFSRDGHRDATSTSDPMQKRETNLCVYIRRRLAMCYRKQGRNKEAVKMMKDLQKEFPTMNVLNIHENLIEALLEMHAYAEVQQVLAKYDDISLPKSATICYTAALMKARTVADKFSPDIATRRGLSAAELAAVDVIHRAVEFNPHVPKYLLELKSIVLPPEHILKRGDSEAVAYAFYHLRHWKEVDGALQLLYFTWEGAFNLVPYPLEKGHYFHPYPSCTEAVDKELLPAHHKVSVYPKKELPFFILFTGFLCTFTAALALTTHQYPELMARVARVVTGWLSAPIMFLLEKLEALLPSHIWHQLTRA